MMRTRPDACGVALGIVLIFGPNVLAPGGEPAADAKGRQPAATASGSFETSVRPLLTRYCLECHASKKPKGGLDLSTLRTEADAVKQRRLLSRIQENMEAGLMPPEGQPLPTRDEIKAVVGWVASGAKSADCGLAVDPGRVTMRRLNRVEYNNTIRDLFGLDIRPADDFPSDDVGYGFDNIGDVLSLPPLLLEGYLTAAEKISEQVIVAGPNHRAPVKTWQAGKLESSAGGQPLGDDARLLFTNGEILVLHTLPSAGSYTIRVRAYGQQAGSEPAKMAIVADDRPLKTFDVKATEGAAAVYEVTTRFKAGEHCFGPAFLNDYYNDRAPDPGRRDRNLVVELIEVEGPIATKGGALPDSHRRIIFRTPKSPGEVHECASAILEKFARRAFRRPVTGGEVARLIRFVDLARENGEGFERGIQLAVQAALVSPQFLFRAEFDRGRRLKKQPEAAGRPLDQFEVASRLSYFLWSSMPDDELFREALEGKLHDPEALSRQVRRMLRDPKAGALVENFAGQWLQLGILKVVAPDHQQFPTFDDGLRSSMRRETEAFFASVMREDKSILDFLDCDYSYLDERMARHYGVKGVTGDQFRRVRLSGGRRGGLITQASILTVTSNPTRTSPVKRGKWVLEQLLGTPPPAPPPNVPVLDEDKKAVEGGSLRRRMEQHRANPSCANCHNRMDPLGFGLENYDAVGAWREKDGVFPIDSAGKLPSGESFDGPEQLKTILKSRRGEFTRCLAEKMFIYALGRGLEESDVCVVDRIVKATSEAQYKFSRLILEIVLSDPFLKRRS